MSVTFIYIVLSVLVVSLVSLIGVLFFFFKKDSLMQFLPWLIAFAAGALLGASFFDLIPESHEFLGRDSFIYVIAGILVFLVFEQVLHWHHEQYHECVKCSNKVVGYSVLLGDGLHNFLDGILIASAFLVSIPIGLATSLAIILHEIPQELGDFGVLIHSGFTRYKALLFNFLSALTSLLGGILGYLFLHNIEPIIPYVVAIGAGGFLYIALVDLFSELRRDVNPIIGFTQVLAVILGLLIIFFVSADHHHDNNQLTAYTNEEISEIN